MWIMHMHAVRQARMIATTDWCAQAAAPAPVAVVRPVGRTPPGLGVYAWNPFPLHCPRVTPCREAVPHRGGPGGGFAGGSLPLVLPLFTMLRNEALEREGSTAGFPVRQNARQLSGWPVPTRGHLMDTKPPAGLEIRTPYKL
ncbi:hypothetical protein GCM10018953_45500 [Streptosporangium nondiastaticum]